MDDKKIFITEILTMLLFSFIFIFLLYPAVIYTKANIKGEAGRYEEAIAELKKIPEVKDSKELILEYSYRYALARLEAGMYKEAQNIFKGLNGYKDSSLMIDECNYCIAGEILKKGDYDKASAMYLALKDYKDSYEKYCESIYKRTLTELEEGYYEGFYENLSIICDMGYFTYDILDEADKERAIRLVNSCSVNIFGDKSSNIPGWDQYTGEACIYRITPEYIYFLSAKHVLEVLNGCKVKMTFYDGSSIDCIIDMVADREEGSDLAMFRIDLMTLPAKLLVELKEINYHVSHYDALNVGDELFILSNYWYKKSSILSPTIFLGFNAYEMSEGNYSDMYYLAFDRCSVEGQSGSPVFDQRGRCIAVTSGYFFKEYSGTVIYAIDCHNRLNGADDLFGSYFD
ncbi:MAG: hypothetical protein K5931_06220 [Lachnospiraceae bacterium]|nr:hypothetical protein [Lachnospiraceae bacterium]